MIRTLNALCLLTCCLLFLWSANPVQAQLDIPAPSPSCTLNQTVGLTEVQIKYSRPGVKGRKIFGDLVPYGELWRTGANRHTKISFSDNVKLEGREIPAGEYSLFTIPEKNRWTIILNKNLKGGGTRGYNQEEDLVRLTVKPEKTAEKVETFTINIGQIRDTHAQLELVWENTRVPMKLEVEVEERVMAQIQDKLINPWYTYYQAARYYYDNEKDLNQALEWITKATEVEEPRYWIVHVKAKIQAALNDYQGAIQTAEHSKKLAQEAENPDYVRLNEKLIAEWKKK